MNANAARRGAGAAPSAGDASWLTVIPGTGLADVIGTIGGGSEGVTGGVTAFSSTHPV